MAVITFDRKELSQLVGKELAHAELNEILPALGLPIEKVEGETFHVDITPDRPDMLSVEGLARAVASYVGVKTGCPKYFVEDSGVELIVDRSVKEVRPFISAAIAREARLTESALLSILQLQEKLHDTVGRKRKKVSIGIYNLDVLAPPITYKAVAPDEVSFVPLESTESMTLEEIRQKHPKGQTYGYILEGHKRYPLLVDSKGAVLSMPPVINSEQTKVTVETRNLFIDATGTSKHAVADALEIICAALADRGAKVQQVTVADGKSRVKTPDMTPLKTSVSAKWINDLLGVEFSEQQLCDYLGRMGHDVQRGGRKLLVISPHYRTDIIHDVDIAEDVAIAHGYNEFDPSLPQFASIGSKKPLEVKCELARDVMIGLGFQEVMNWYITNKERNFWKMNLPEEPCVTIANPKTAEFTIFRTWCIPSLLEVLSNNRHVPMPQKIFEIGDVAVLDGEKARELRKLSCAFCDAKAGFSAMKSIAEAFLFEMDLRAELKPLVGHPSFIPGRVAQLLIDGKVAGMLGEIHPQVLNNWGVEQPVAVFEMEIR